MSDDITGGEGFDPTREAESDALASLYLDGRTDAEQSARVESDPALLDEVERLRQVRAVLGATMEPPPISVREAHLAGALDVWDRMSGPERSGDATPGSGIGAAAAAAISTPGAASLDDRRRRRSGRSRTSGGASGGSTARWLVGAAAALVVVAGAGILVRGVTSGSDESTETADVVTDAPAAASNEAEEVADQAADEAVGESDTLVFDAVEEGEVASTDDRDQTVAGDSADAAMTESAPGADADDGDGSDGMDPMADDSEPVDDPGAPAADSGTEIGLDDLTSPTELADFAAFAFYARTDPAPANDDIAPAFPTCESELAPLRFTVFAGPALYRGRQVIVAVDERGTPQAVAYTAECELVAQAPLPSQDAFESGEG